MSKQSKRAAFASRQKNIRLRGYDRKDSLKRAATFLARSVDAEVYRRAPPAPSPTKMLDYSVKAYDYDVSTVRVDALAGLSLVAWGTP